MPNIQTDRTDEYKQMKEAFCLESGLRIRKEDVEMDPLGNTIPMFYFAKREKGLLGIPRSRKVAKLKWEPDLSPRDYLAKPSGLEIHIYDPTVEESITKFCTDFEQRFGLPTTIVRKYQRS